ncbi:MAG TPA: ribosomal protein S18-alanine N-acetyltransferase [Candidatus Syntrophosphaera sp.]|nr:ribosomal protein S18-alanine N-acetyltransferase [Candidatus Syntrophosphaera sp.]
MSTFTVRPMRSADLPAVIRIEQLAFSSPWPLEAFDDAILQDAWVICSAEDLLGYIMYHNVLDESMIINFAIDPAFRNQGHGTALLKETLDIMVAKGIRTFYLDVRASNATARKIYRGFGFEDIGVRKHYYSLPDEDAIVMAKHIKETA